MTKIRKVVKKAIVHEGDGVKVAGAINAAIAANVAEGGKQSVSSRQRIRVEQRDGVTVVEELDEDDDGAPTDRGEAR